MRWPAERSNNIAHDDCDKTQFFHTSISVHFFKNKTSCVDYWAFKVLVEMTITQSLSFVSSVTPLSWKNNKWFKLLLYSVCRLCTDHVELSFWCNFQWFQTKALLNSPCHSVRSKLHVMVGFGWMLWVILTSTMENCIYFSKVCCRCVVMLSFLNWISAHRPN